MPARKLPTPQDAAAARRIVLDGLARDADPFELVTELAPLHPRNNTFPGEVFLHLAADVLDWCGASRQQPLPPLQDDLFPPERSPISEISDIRIIRALFLRTSRHQVMA